MGKQALIVKCSEYRGTGNCQKKVNSEKCRGANFNGGICCGKFELASDPQPVLETKVNNLSTSSLKGGSMSKNGESDVVAVNRVCAGRNGQCAYPATPLTKCCPKCGCKKFVNVPAVVNAEIILPHVALAVENPQISNFGPGHDFKIA